MEFADSVGAEITPESHSGKGKRGFSFSVSSSKENDAWNEDTSSRATTKVYAVMISLRGKLFLPEYTMQR